MASRQETEPKRSYTDGPTKSRIKEINWNAASEEALLGIAGVCAITGLSRTALADRLEAGTFPPASYHGKNRVWSLGSVKRWCQAVTAQADRDTSWLEALKSETCRGGSNG